MKITRKTNQPVMAADFDNLDGEPMESADFEVEDDETFDDNLDDMADTIEIDNNIDGHLIAECDKCHGIFISAMIESDQEVEKISGICPLCEKESDQYIKWVVKAIE